MENELKNYYQQNYLKYGEHENSLGWTKGKQFIRFYNLTKFFNLTSLQIVDIGCGFGDILNFFKANKIQFARYTGIDLMDQFVQIGKKNHHGENVQFIVGNYVKSEKLETDIVIASGIFGHKVSDSDDDNYAYIENVLKKSFEEARVGVAFDFISDKTDFKTSNSDFHASPTRVLDIAYKFSRNVILDNSSLPFEFSIVIFKDDSFKKERTVFEKFIKDHEDMFRQGKL